MFVKRSQRLVSWTGLVNLSKLNVMNPPSPLQTPPSIPSPALALQVMLDKTLKMLFKLVREQ